jgi:4-amino-4-deoxy-L-arabinose transferase-like glycosyltransferase
LSSAGGVATPTRGVPRAARWPLTAARRLPAAAWWCALIAFLNAAAWSLVTPPLHVPDETVHYQYVQYLAETGQVPHDPERQVLSNEEAATMGALAFNSVVGRWDDRVPLTELEERAVEAVEADPPSRASGGGTVESSSQPPLYYGIEAGVYLASPWKSPLDRLALMRLVSALLAGATALFSFLFLREVLAPPWTWTVGGLAVAFQPLLGFISSGVTPDALFFAAAAALFFTLARAFKRGLTLGLGAAIGVALAVGVLAKLSFVALVPGALLGLALLAWRGRPRREAVKGAAVAGAMLAVVSLGYVAMNELVWDRPAWGQGVVTAVQHQAGGPNEVRPISLQEQLSYTWQLYMPRLPFMNDQFVNFPPRSTWLNGTVGVFGWLDTFFPPWVYDLALGVALALLALLIVALWQRRAAIRTRLAELTCYAAVVSGLLVAIGFSGVYYRLDTGFAFEQARYLLPLLPLYGAAIGLAAQAPGPRLGRPLGVGLVTLAMAHGLFAQLLVVSRFYG